MGLLEGMEDEDECIEGDCEGMKPEGEEIEPMNDDEEGMVGRERAMKMKRKTF